MKHEAETGHGEIHFSYLFKTGNKKVNETSEKYRVANKYKNKLTIIWFFSEVKFLQTSTETTTSFFQKNKYKSSYYHATVQLAIFKLTFKLFTKNNQSLSYENYLN